MELIKVIISVQHRRPYTDQEKLRFVQCTYSNALLLLKNIPQV